MSESLPECRWCNEHPVTHPMTDEGVFFHPENDCPSGLGHPVVRLPLSEDQWRLLHSGAEEVERERQILADALWKMNTQPANNRWKYGDTAPAIIIAKRLAGEGGGDEPR